MVKSASCSSCKLYAANKSTRSFFTHLRALIKVDFAVVAALVRLGHKYAITDVYEEALARLSAHYSSDLDRWRRCRAGNSSLRTTPQDAMTVVELARLTNSAHLLPTALLVCTTLETELFTSNILAPGNLVRVMQGKALMTFGVRDVPVRLVRRG